jgi:hypothetical protein
LKRREAERWWQLLARAERGLRFSAVTEGMIELDGATATRKMGPNDFHDGVLLPWASAVCADAVMESGGVHRCIFTINRSFQTTIGVVPVGTVSDTLTGTKAAALAAAAASSCCSVPRWVAAGEWASDQPGSCMLTWDGRLWHHRDSGRQNGGDWVEWQHVTQPAELQGVLEEQDIRAIFRDASVLELELDLREGSGGTLRATIARVASSAGWNLRCGHTEATRINLAPADRVMVVVATGLDKWAEEYGGFCWCAELAGEGDSVSVAWAPPSDGPPPSKPVE